MAKKERTPAQIAATQRMKEANAAKRATSGTAPVARAIRDEDFTIRKGRVFHPFDDNLNSRDLVWHEFRKVKDGIEHIRDGQAAAVVRTENWADYVKSCSAAAAACNYEMPPQ